MNNLPPNLDQVGEKLAHVPLYSITYYEFAAIGLFFVISTVCLLKFKNRRAFFLFFSALFFLLHPVLVFTLHTQRVVVLTSYLQPAAFCLLAAYTWLSIVEAKPVK